MTEIEKKALGYLGLAARARALTIGVPLTCEALKNGVRGKTPQAVIEASDTSDNTHKRVCDRIDLYDTPHAYRIYGAGYGKYRRDRIAEPAKVY